MLTLSDICAPGEHPDGVLVLPLELRQKSRLRAAPQRWKYFFHGVLTPKSGTV
jgi:hypothetical protein